MKDLSLYIHIPFCERKCLYCDFMSYEVGSDLSGKDFGEITKYFSNLCNEIESWKKKCSEYTVQTIYFGGGTPSLVNAKHIAEVMNIIRACFKIAVDAEISIECNPNSLDDEKLAVYKNVGFNRISIGVQSFRNKTLKTLGRIHNVKQAVGAIKLARKYFENINIDLIHSIPGCTPKIPSSILKQVVHVSAYCLTSDKFLNPSDKISIKQQLKIENKFVRFNLIKYEVSNFARSGFECRHNLVYWTGGEYLGFGAAAHSFFDGKRFCGSEIFSTDGFTRDDEIMLGLRLASGISCKLIKDKKSEVENLVLLGLIRINNGRLVCTQKGFFVLNQIISKLL